MQAIDKGYRAKVRTRYTLNAVLFEGLCKTLASNISGWLQQMAKAEKQGKLQCYAEDSAYEVRFGKHTGETLGSLGRKTLSGYAFLMSTSKDRQEALQHINVLLDQKPEDSAKQEQAEAYVMKFGHRRGDALGSMLPDTLKRIKAQIERDEARTDLLEELRQKALSLLRFTPPGFPNIRCDGLTPRRQRELEAENREALEAFGALPEAEDLEESAEIEALQELPEIEDEADALFRGPTERERQAFRELQQKAYAATRTSSYVPMQWERADGCIHSRGMALVYDPAKKRYLVLLPVLDTNSRHRRKLTVQGDLYDVNNPGVKLSSRNRNVAMLFELEFDRYQQRILDYARHNAERWKEGKNTTGGCIRSATLHAHYAAARHHWWFEMLIAVGIKPQEIIRPEHIVGVHFDGKGGIFVSVLALDGSTCDQFQLDERRIATLLRNRYPEQQAAIRPEQRTTKERQHRIADALVAICEQYRAQLGAENIGYRRTVGPQQIQGQEDHSRTVVGLLEYKLPLANLAKPLDVTNVAPKRDCGGCGQRHTKSQVQGEHHRFACPSCGHTEEQHANTSREVARRVLWMLARKRAPKKAG
jgi:predicted RNA-binding Zn-ribbon protein involved in translation (DUF1610 family)